MLPAATSCRPWLALSAPTQLPEGLEDVSKYPNLVAELLRRGWTDAEVKKLVGENILRVWASNEQIAARLKSERPASTATIESTDGARNR